MIVADTDVLIDALHGREPSLGLVTEGLRSGSLATTAITRFELLSGSRTERARQSVESLLAALPVFDFDETAASAASAARHDLEARGSPISMADYLIAGICLARSASLLTRNQEHFRGVAGLRLASGMDDGPADGG